MASGDSEVDLDVQRPQDLHFVDHVEVKITSPEKEVISPNKASVRNPLKLIVNGKENGLSDTSQMIDTTEVKDTEINNVKTEIADISECLEASSEETNQSFIDREESFTDVEEREVLMSPNKTVDVLFNFLNASSQSLDALNNNSEVNINETSDIDNEDSEEGTTVTGDIYLGKEVDLHQKETGTDVDAKSRESNDASVNLYWYNSTLDVDVAELEAFKDSTSQSDNITSELHVNIANRYYNSKNVEIDLDAVNQNVYRSEVKLETKKSNEDKEKWSPGFESASSRLLDLASELKSEPKERKNQNNENIRSTDNTKLINTPWGLDDSRVSTKAVEKGQDELPEMISVSKSETEQRVIEMLSEIARQGRQGEYFNQTDYVSSVEYVTQCTDRRESEDVADAIGYFEKADRPVRQTITKTESEIVSMKTIKPDKEENKTEHGTSVGKPEDVADAIGYMELADRPVDEVISSSDTQTLEAEYAKRSGMTQDSETRAEEMNQVIVSEDITDATGYIEIANKLVEQRINQLESVALESIQQDIVEQNLKEAESSIVNVNMESQIMMQTEAENKTLDKEGIDMPDADFKLPEGHGNKVEEIKHEAAEVSSALGARVQLLPFESFTLRRKYLIGESSEEALQKLGGMFLETETFVDEYLDDENFTLTLQDCWLRLRNKKFEMKLNAAFGEGPNKSPSVLILTNENDIKDVLMRMCSEELQQRRKVSETHLDVLVDTLNFMEFVTFETRRNRYQLDDFIITMDMTNFAYQVAEVEVVANTAQEMIQFLNGMDALSEKLGFLPLQSYPC